MSDIVKDDKKNRYVAPDASKWKSRAEYCRSVGINPHSLNDAICKGTPEPEAIQSLLDNLNKCFDHKGNAFASVKEKCKHYGVPYGTYWNRIKHGCSEEQALETPSGELYGLGFFCEKGKYIAPDGSEWASRSAYCRSVGINKHTLSNLIHRGVPDDVAIQKLLDSGCFDHLGNKFPTIKDKCAYYNISPSAYGRRKKLGWTEKDALETPVKSVSSRFNKEDLKRCQEAGVSVGTVRQRIGRGIKDKDALFAPVVEKEYFDHKGIKYTSLNAMCKAYNIAPSTYLRRIAYGWSIEKALEAPISPARKEHVGEEQISRCGLKMKIIDTNSTDGYIIEFEDGTIVKYNEYRSFTGKKIPHPTLKLRGLGSFCSYTTKYVGPDSEGNVWYETEKDGVKNIMTPQMMLKESKVCQ